MTSKKWIALLLAAGICMNSSMLVLANVQEGEPDPLTPMATMTPRVSATPRPTATPRASATPKATAGSTNASTAATQNSKTTNMLVNKTSYTNEQMLSMLNGKWEGVLHVTTVPGVYVNDPITLNFLTEKREVFVTVKSYDAIYFKPNTWSVGKSQLTLSIGQGKWEGKLTLWFEDESNLVGAYEQYGRRFEQRLVKTSETPTDYTDTTQFVFEGIPYETWYAEMAKYSEFQNGGGSVIPYKYELGNWEKAVTRNDSFPTAALDAATDDVEKMLLLMDYICDNFQHDGLSGMPDDWDSKSIEAYYQERGGIECRGLSVMFTELLLAAGIPAKSVMCVPYLDPSEECHVLVQAYSQSRQQWIMLDPTYRLILKNSSGQYVNLMMFREALITGEELIPNDNAGHNSMPFYMPYYRAYMTKNAFRFSNATEFYPGSENSTSNVENMLTPKNWMVPYQYSRPERLTKDIAAFWAPPTIS